VAVTVAVTVKSKKTKQRVPLRYVYVWGWQVYNQQDHRLLCFHRHVRARGAALWRDDTTCDDAVVTIPLCGDTLVPIHVLQCVAVILLCRYTCCGDTLVPILGHEGPFNSSLPKYLFFKEWRQKKIAKTHRYAFRHTTNVTKKNYASRGFLNHASRSLTMILIRGQTFGNVVCFTGLNRISPRWLVRYRSRWLLNDAPLNNTSLHSCTTSISLHTILLCVSPSHYNTSQQQTRSRTIREPSHKNASD